MPLKEDLQLLISELDRLHGENGLVDWAAVHAEPGLPSFDTADNGYQRHFTRAALQAMRHAAEEIFSNDPDLLASIEIDEFARVLKKAVVNLHAAGELIDFIGSGYSDGKSKIVSTAKQAAASLATTYTHYFPAWTLGMEALAPFQIGPVTIMSREHWVGCVDFPDSAKDNFFNEREANWKWKTLLRRALRNNSRKPKLPGLAGIVYRSVCDCPSIVQITINGHEKNRSRKIGTLISKTALDALSLALGQPDFFHQQALQDERLGPFGSDQLVETNGKLWSPGMSVGKRVPSVDGERVKNALDNMQEELTSLGLILQLLTEPEQSVQHRLAQRWATALDWYGEGCREKSDAIALAKIGTALDVLSCGGKASGIVQMIVNMTGTNEDEEVISGREPKTLKQLVEDIYNDGRSRILHGTHHNRLKSFSKERDRATSLARIVLMVSAGKLTTYNGASDRKGFREMSH